MNKLISILLVSLMCAMPSTANSGLLSSLAKLGKKVDSPDGISKSLVDIDLRHSDIDLPKGETADILTVKLDNNKKWVIKDSNGNIVSNTNTLKNPILVIDKAALPRNLDDLKALSPETPMLIRKGSNVYLLERKAELALKVGNIEIPTPNTHSLNKALYHLDTPWFTQDVHILGAKKSPKGAFGGLSVEDFKNSPELLRGQTIAIGGSIKNGVIHAAGSNWPISELRLIAQQHDLSLILMESKGKISPQAIQKKLHIKTDEPIVTTSQFLNHFDNSKSTVSYEWKADAKNQVLIQRMNKPVPSTTENLNDIALNAINVASISNIIIVRPDEARQRELKLRLVWWLPSSISTYLIISIFAGFISFGTCRALLRKIWPSRGRENFSSRFTFILFKTLRLLIILLVIIPLFGLPCLIFNIVYKTYRVIRAVIMGFIHSVLYIKRLIIPA